MSDLRILPRPPTRAEEVSAYTVEMLEKLLAQAKAGEIVSVVAVSWAGPSEPRIDMSTEDRMLALGALRTMEHCLVRDWLDGKVQS